MGSIAEADADGAGGEDDFALRVHQMEAVDRVFDGDGADLIGLVADHPAELFVAQEVHGHHAEAGAEDPVEGGG